LYSGIGHDVRHPRLTPPLIDGGMAFRQVPEPT
jgi:hypothetical protein